MEWRSAAGLALAVIEDGKRALVVLSNNKNAKRVYVALNEEVFSNTCLTWFWIGYIPIDRNDRPQRLVGAPSAGIRKPCLPARPNVRASVH